jgi:hypothetical protein
MKTRNIPEMWRRFLLAIQGDKEAWAFLVLKHFDDDIRRRVSKRYSPAVADQSDVLSEVSTSPIKAWTEEEFAEKQKISDPEIQFKLMHCVMMRVADCRAVDLSRKTTALVKNKEKHRENYQDFNDHVPGAPKGDVSPSTEAIEKEMQQIEQEMLYLAAEKLRENDQWIIHRWIDCQRPNLTDLPFREKVAEEFESSLEAATKRIQRAFEKVTDEVHEQKKQRKLKKLNRKVLQGKPSPAALAKLSPDDRAIIEAQDRVAGDADQLIQAVMIKFKCRDDKEASGMIQRARAAWKTILQSADSSLV